MKAADHQSDEVEPTQNIVEDVAALLKQRFPGELDLPEFPQMEEQKASYSQFNANKIEKIREERNPEYQMYNHPRPKPTIYIPNQEQEADIELRGIQNNRGENNCFINVVIQSLWHLGSFRHRFLEDDPHIHNNEMVELEVRNKVLILKTPSNSEMYDKYSKLKNNDFWKNTQELVPEQRQDWLSESHEKNKAQELCLHCNLRSLFMEYKDLSNYNVLQPSKVRDSLYRISQSQAKGLQQGAMGQPQQVFEDILNYIHRDSVFPKFTESLMSNRDKENDDNFDILNTFDSFPCNPTCPAHRCFGFQLCDQAFCLKCKMTHPETLQNVTVESYVRLYVSEFKQFKEQLTKEKPDKDFGIEDILLYHFKNNLNSMRKRKFAYSCSCGGRNAAFQKWCIEVPTIFALTLEWAPDIVLGYEQKEAYQQMRIVLKMIQPIIDIRTFLNVGLQSSQIVNKYVLRQIPIQILRGFIAYYGRHYVSYFYSEVVDRWVRFDDDVIKEVGNYSDVQQKVLKGKEKIVQIFYESLVYIQSMLKQRYDRKANRLKQEIGVGSVAAPTHHYFSVEGRKTNYFWKGKEGLKNNNCSIF